MTLDDLHPQVRQAVVESADSILRVGEGCTCFDCQQQAVRILLDNVVTVTRDACAHIADTHGETVSNDLSAKACARNIAERIRREGACG